MYLRRCMANTCFLTYTGEQNSFHFLSNHTCAGDKIWWDFVSTVKSSRMSVTSFCNEMTRKYKTSNILSAPFMTISTFVTWIFPWMSSMQIDFRKEVDPWCKYEPKILACDGTHIGVSMKYMKVDNPITSPDNNEVPSKPVHKR